MAKLVGSGNIFDSQKWRPVRNTSLF